MTGRQHTRIKHEQTSLLIAQTRKMVEDVGRRPATVAEARELLGVPKRATV